MGGKELTHVKLDRATTCALIDLLYRLGDDSLLIGHRNSEWTGLGPILEEDIAFSSMAQDKMGHALAYYNMLHELGEGDPDAIAYRRDAAAFRCCTLVTMECFDDDSPGDDDESLCNNPLRDDLVRRGDWALSLVRQYLFSGADAIRAAEMASSSYEPLKHFARKIRGEVKYHTMHDRAMMERLARATDESSRRLQFAVNKLFSHALGMFEPTDFDAALAEAGICPTEAQLGHQWRGQVEAFIDPIGLTLPDATKSTIGGRRGRSDPHLQALLDELQKVHRLDSAATW
jgi:ring-1,2-phenylacetyl-CoA epoxidase subunit PaaC